jgi:SET domain-containing protein
MINHFHQIGPVPNVKFVTAYIAELPHILVVVLRPIAEGAEILIDYG